VNHGLLFLCFVGKQTLFLIFLLSIWRNMKGALVDVVYGVSRSFSVIPFLRKHVDGAHVDAL